MTPKRYGQDRALPSYRFDKTDFPGRGDMDYCLKSFWPLAANKLLLIRNVDRNRHTCNGLLVVVDNLLQFGLDLICRVPALRITESAKT
jgi:hypothetical protein